MRNINKCHWPVSSASRRTFREVVNTEQEAGSEEDLQGDRQAPVQACVDERKSEVNPEQQTPG